MYLAKQALLILCIAPVLSVMVSIIGLFLINLRINKIMRNHTVFGKAFDKISHDGNMANKNIESLKVMVDDALNELS